jgi:hypothetical protein
LNQIVEWVDFEFEVFNKRAASLHGPGSGMTPFTGFGGLCENYPGEGDPIIKYHQLANRWIHSFFFVSTSGWLECVAVSQTADATGGYFRYAFPFDQMPDYQKLGIWPDAYYLTLNAPGFPDVCALDRVLGYSAQTIVLSSFRRRNGRGTMSYS